VIHPRPRALVVGSGLTGATAARKLHEAGWDVLVSESSHVWGGNVRGDRLNGIEYEPHGAHISHTDDEEVAAFLRKHCEMLPYRHRVKTEVNDRLLSWPPQVDELRKLPEWPTIQAELEALPPVPDVANFETYAVSIMGTTLYDWFCRPYTVKQWGCDPTELSASFAPKRIGLRSDGYTDLFYDRWQGWPLGGWVTLIDSLLAPLDVALSSPLTVDNINPTEWDTIVVTAALDDFLGLESLPWRGVRLEHRWVPGVEGTYLEAGVVNHPGLDQEYTRRIETKHMSGQAGVRTGTVISTEYPGADARHYPIDDVEGANRHRANNYIRTLYDALPNAIPAGRLATYTYIDTDQAVRQGINAARTAQRREAA